LHYDVTSGVRIMRHDLREYKLQRI
jgi:hypothetical protein